MNNRGQSLALFIMIFPIVFLLLTAVYDIGNMTLTKNELDSINYLAIEYGLDHLEDEDINDKINKLIIKNKKDIIINKIEITENNINIVLEDKIKTITKINILKIKSSYTGYIEDDKKIIEKDK